MTRNEWKRRNIRMWWTVAFAMVYYFVFRLVQGILGAWYGERNRY